MPGARCNHPISSSDAFKAFPALSRRLQIKINVMGLIYQLTNQSTHQIYIYIYKASLTST
ncbi:hypothetical protein DsansV1_C29g0213151 [Dioscorea sansibarensis]